MFVDGEYLDHTFQTTPEPLSVIAKIVVQGDTLKLEDLAVYCGSGDERVPVGIIALRRVIKEVEAYAVMSGFRELIVTGHRLTGATPGRSVSLKRRLQ